MRHRADALIRLGRGPPCKRAEGTTDRAKQHSKGKNCYKNRTTQSLSVRPRAANRSALGKSHLRGLEGSRALNWDFKGLIQSVF